MAKFGFCMPKVNASKGFGREEISAWVLNEFLSGVAGRCAENQNVVEEGKGLCEGTAYSHCPAEESEL